MIPYFCGGDVYMNIDKKLIGIRIMIKRKEKGLSQEELSEMIGYSKNHISNIERGKYIPTTTFIFEICTVLGETPDYYLIGNPTEKTDKITELIKTLPKYSQNILLKLIKVYISEIANEQPK